THTHICKKHWNSYLLKCHSSSVRCHIVDLIISAMQAVQKIERPLYYIRKECETGDTDCEMEEKTGEGCTSDGSKSQQTCHTADEGIASKASIANIEQTKKQTAKSSELAKLNASIHRQTDNVYCIPVSSNRNCNNNKNNGNNGNKNNNNNNNSDNSENKERSNSDIEKDIPNPQLTYFESRSIVVQVLDQLCKLLVIAHHYRKQYDQYWSFFRKFVELGCPEIQLLLDRKWITECSRFLNKKKLLIAKQLDELSFNSKQKTNSDLHCSEMANMLSIIVCSCVPSKLRQEIEENAKNENAMAEKRTTNLSELPNRYMCDSVGYQPFVPNLPETAIPHSNMLLKLPSSEEKALLDLGVFIRLWKHNARAMSRIIYHLSWMNPEYSDKCVELFIKQLKSVSFLFHFLLFLLSF
ncbi:RNA recognition motif-containing protein RRM, partial [Reticulomyxa filosa]